MSNGRGKKETRYAEATPEGIKVAKRLIKEGKLTPAQENELDSYNKFVEGIANKIAATPQSELKRPSKIFTKAVLSQPPVQRFKRPTKKQVLDSSGKPVKNLTQDMADGGEVFDLTTEMVIDE